VLGLVEIPEHGGAVLAAGCAERAVGGDGDRVDVAGVADVVGLDLAGSELPDLKVALLAKFAHLNKARALGMRFGSVLW
jgi:hypothetical protein